MNYLKTKVDDSDVGKLKTIPVDLKKLRDVVGNDVVKNTKFNTIKIKVNNLEKKIPDRTTLIHINQHNSDKQNSEKRLERLIKKYQIQVVYWLQLFWIQKLVKLKTWYQILVI